MTIATIPARTESWRRDIERGTRHGQVNVQGFTHARTRPNAQRIFQISQSFKAFFKFRKFSARGNIWGRLYIFAKAGTYGNAYGMQKNDDFGHKTRPFDAATHALAPPRK